MLFESKWFQLGIAVAVGMVAMLLVIGCPPNAIAYSCRFFKASDLTKVGAVATPVLLWHWSSRLICGGKFWGWYK